MSPTSTYHRWENKLIANIVMKSNYCQYCPKFADVVTIAIYSYMVTILDEKYINYCWFKWIHIKESKKAYFPVNKLKVNIFSNML